jgi:hypothetical protein
MKSPRLEPARVTGMPAAAVVFVALALVLGKPARAEAAVTEEQAEAATVAATAVDAAAAEEWTDVPLDARIVERVVWSEPEAPPSWFPALQEQPDLTLTPSPVQPVNLSAAGTTAMRETHAVTNEHAVIPLPPAAWTGLAGLASLAVIHGRKAIVRFFT